MIRLKEYIVNGLMFPSDSWINNNPEAVTEIVRCKDCRYASAGEAVMSGNWKYGDCHNPRYRGSLHVANVRADGFCSWGERKEAE